MPTTANPQFDAAVCMVRWPASALTRAHPLGICAEVRSGSLIQVLNGADTREAWIQCGKPGANEVSALHNTRKRARKLKQKDTENSENTESNATAGIPEAVPVALGKGKAKAGFRLRTDQVQKRRVEKEAADLKWRRVHA